MSGSRTNKPVVWEALEQSSGNVLNLRRTPVPTGWLVASGPELKDLIFVPDPEHEWLFASPWEQTRTAEAVPTTGK